jgi:hypothetical protein
MQDSYKKRIADKFSCYHSVKNCLSVCRVRINIKIHGSVVFLFFLCRSHRGKNVSVREYGAEEGILA